MAFQTPITIAKALERIQKREYVLPAIQREFVWKPEQISRLFDSLMRGYPIGSFLFWNVDGHTSGAYAYYGFMRDFHQKVLRARRFVESCPDALRRLYRLCRARFKQLDEWLQAHRVLWQGTLDAPETHLDQMEDQ